MTIRRLGVFATLVATLRTFTRAPVFFLGLSMIQLIPAQPLLRLFGWSEHGPWYVALAPVAIDQLFLDLVQAAILDRALRLLERRKVPLRETLGPGLRRAFPVLLVSLGQALATGLGFALLVLPGFVVTAVFLAAGPVCLAGQRPLRSFVQSWNLTRGTRWPIAGALLILWTPYLALVGGLAFYSGFTGRRVPYEVYVIGAASVVISAWTSILGAAVHRALRPEDEREQLVDVFA